MAELDKIEPLMPIKFLPDGVEYPLLFIRLFVGDGTPALQPRQPRLRTAEGIKQLVVQFWKGIVERINGGCQVVVDRATERSEAGRNSPESGFLGGAQSFGVTESVTVSPKICAPVGLTNSRFGVRFDR